MRFFFIFFLFSISNITSFAQIVTVKDALTDEPIANVYVVNDSNKINYSTNNKGQVHLGEIDNSHSYTLISNGYLKTHFNKLQLEKSDYIIRLKPAINTLDEVVISANRWSQLHANIPKTISTISAREISFFNPQTSADLLGQTGEVFIQKSQLGGGSPMIRGFATNRLLYSIDGIRMNTAIFRAGNLQQIISLDPFTVEKAEIVFGPGSVIYGSDAIGGVMSFQTLMTRLSITDKTEVYGKAAYRFSSANQEQTLHADVQVARQKWAMLFSVTNNEFDDLRMGSRGNNEYRRNFYVQQTDSGDRIVQNNNPDIQRPTAYNQQSLLFKLLIKPHKHVLTEYSFHHSQTGAYARYDRLIEQQPNGNPSSAVWNYGPQKWTMHQVNITINKNLKLFSKAAIKAGFQQFEESRIDRPFSGANRFRLRTQLEQVNAFSVNTDFIKLVRNHQFFYGVEGVLNIVKSEGTAVLINTNTSIDAADRYPQGNWYTAGAYFAYQFSPTSKLNIQTGARITYYGVDVDFSKNKNFTTLNQNKFSSNNANITGNVGITYQLLKRLIIAGGISTAFRSPNIDDLGKFFENLNGGVVVPNTNLNAEYAYSGEGKLAYGIKELLQFEASAFYTILDHVLVLRPFKVNGSDSVNVSGVMLKSYAIQNAAYAYVFGWQARIETKLFKQLYFSTQYVWQKGNEQMTNETESSLRHAAPAMLTTKLTYRGKFIMVQFYTISSAEVSYQQLNQEERLKTFIYAKDANGNPYAPAWLTLNAKLQVKVTKHMQLQAGIENILDERYRPYSWGIVAPGRNIITACRFNF
jgi:hemoglobin/transferrin/lactoferrin receptor protein